MAGKGSHNHATTRSLLNACLSGSSALPAEYFHWLIADLRPCDPRFKSNFRDFGSNGAETIASEIGFVKAFLSKF